MGQFQSTESQITNLLSLELFKSFMVNGLKFRHFTYELVVQGWNQQILVRIANREDSLEAESNLSLHCLLRAFWRATRLAFKLLKHHKICQNVFQRPWLKNPVL